LRRAAGDALRTVRSCGSDQNPAQNRASSLDDLNPTQNCDGMSSCFQDRSPRLDGKMENGEGNEER
jgi:hypothetical protein